MDQSGRAERINRAGARTFGHNSIVFEPKGGGSFQLSTAPADRPIFKAAFASVDVGGSQPVQSIAPMILVQNRVLPGGAAPLENDVFNVAGVRYKVTAIEPRDGGTTRCHLRRA